MIKNQLNYNNNSNYKGSTSINFLNKNIEIDYRVKNNLITLKSPNNAKNIKIDTKIELSPFNLNANIVLNKQNLNFLIDELIFYILNLKPDLLGNLNGDIKFFFTNIEHELIRNGILSLNISQKNVNFIDVLFNVGEIGQIKTEAKYIKENGDVIFHSSNSLFVKNKKEFAKKFQLKLGKVKDINVLDFKIEKNITTGLIPIFDIKINQAIYDGENNVKSRYNIKNSQELKSLVKNIINN